MSKEQLTDIRPEDLNEKSFSVRTVPDSWRQAEADSEVGEPDPSPLPAKRSMGVVPLGSEADVLTGVLAALAMSVAVGAAWYAFETQDAITSPWLSVVAGVLIAVAVRLGAGAEHSDVRATLSVIFYLLTVFGVAYFAERYDYNLIFGHSPGFQETQTELVRDRLTQPETMLAWAIGLFANIQTGYLLRNRRRRGF